MPTVTVPGAHCLSVSTAHCRHSLIRLAIRNQGRSVPASTNTLIRCNQPNQIANLATVIMMPFGRSTPRAYQIWTAVWHFFYFKGPPQSRLSRDLGRNVKYTVANSNTFLKTCQVTLALGLGSLGNIKATAAQPVCAPGRMQQLSGDVSFND